MHQISSQVGMTIGYKPPHYKCSYTEKYFMKTKQNMFYEKAYPPASSRRSFHSFGTTAEKEWAITKDTTVSPYADMCVHTSSY